MSPISDDRLGGDNLRYSSEVPFGTDGAVLRDDSSEVEPFEAVDWEKARAENESWLRAVCYKILKDRNAVEDVMQNVWLDVFRGGVSLRDPSKVKPWLRSVVVNKSNEYIRKLVRDRNTKQLYDEQSSGTKSDDSSKSLLDFLLAKERKEVVRNAIAKLSVSDREILLKKYMQDKGYKEIAEDMRSTVTAVQSQLHRARLRLREEIQRLYGRENV